MFKLIALTVFLAISGTQAFWTACPGVLAPTSITSDVCSGSSCNVQLGQQFSAEATITFTQAHARLDTRITVFVLGVGINIPQDPPLDNICNSLFRDGVLTGCPTTPGVATVWRINLTVTSNTPTVNNARVRFEGLENGVSQVCADVTATIA
ncbi:unnamed protein product [Chironomus riparius]|uniref:MD-2-related lipid-recognition domain-containing protein n=1 Tax=Chironomus riparius TaxID=315576 RepID=A0A9N9S3B3_9DIPT|nr:unnamed protein product [Chironomus riparius]